MARTVASFIQGLERSLAKSPKTWRKLGSVTQQCGWARRTEGRLSALAEALDRAGIYSSIDLTDSDIGLDTTVRFSKFPMIDLAHVFRTERALGHHLAMYPEALEQALSELGALRHIAGGSKRERKYSFDDAEYRPDLIFQSASGSLVVLELERQSPKRESVDQLEQYLRATSLSTGKPVVGVLITGSPSSRSLEQHIRRQMSELRVYFDVRWLTYDVAVGLTSRDQASPPTG